MECLSCLSKNVIIDSSRAEIMCEDCGTASMLNDIQRETEFEEMDNGRIAAIGHIIVTGKHATKQNTINKASAKIQNLCAKLSLTKSLGEFAVGIFESALGIGMTRGRNALVTVGACVYLAARIKQQSLMLLDVSDKLNVNVYVLGKAYNELREKMGQRVSDVDPCLFIDRFAIELELGDKTAEVSMTALKLLQRMKRDWISTGRRPAGITAAALLIAARLHRFDRDYADVARIAGVSSHTTKKRLQEWAKTSTANLTLEQLGKVDYEDEFDPPAFTNKKVEDKITTQIDGEGFEKLREEVKALCRRLEDEGVEKKREKVTGSYYQRLIDSVETGEVDLVSLFGPMDDEDNDAIVELDGRKDLLGEITGMRDVFMSLNKKEALLSQERKVEDELPLVLDIKDDDDEGIWPPPGMVISDQEETDDEEFTRIHMCDTNTALMKLKVWIAQNPDYYKNKKKSEEKRLMKRQKEVDSGKKIRAKRNRKCYDYMVNVDELLSEIKGGMSTMPIKTQTVETTTAKGEQQEEGDDEDRDGDDEYTGNEDRYKDEQDSVSEEAEQVPQYDYND